MVRYVVLVWLCGAATVCGATEPVDRLPKPDYERHPSDPVWLVQVVQFHGHLGPSVVAGARIGMAGLRAIDATGYFDVQVVCEGPFARPPQACFLDGLQVTTGATLGKRTLQWVQADRIAVRFKNTHTGKTAELRPTPALLGLLPSFKAPSKTASGGGTDRKADDARLESVARKIAAMPESEIIGTEPGR
jgi:formylmethanofuran dehydrogenase subunit E